MLDRSMTAQLIAHFNSSNIDGDNVLHHAFRRRVGYPNMTDVVAILGEEMVSTLSHTVNHMGLLPMDVLTVQMDQERSRFPTGDTYLEMEGNFFGLMRYTLINPLQKPLDAVISFDELRGNYSLMLDSPLYQNMHKACIIANETRRHLLRSTTRPEANNLDSDSYSFLKRKIDDMRDQCNNLDISAKVKIYKQHQMGNCYEFAELGYYLSVTLENISLTEVFEIENGDHVFNIFNRNTTTLAHDFSTWNADTVLCDAWAGVVSPFSTRAIYNHRAYCVNNNECHLLTFFNPRYHRLQQKKMDEVKPEISSPKL